MLTHDINGSVSEDDEYNDEEDEENQDKKRPKNLRINDSVVSYKDLK